ncbi:MAG: thiamine phosphate synthase [Hydrogenothermaceae bacterium]|nr:thiamine phosphate synthase [Hydrogenothermaceae bacterium]
MKGLYVITDEKLTPYGKMFDMVKQALEGGAKFVQLRDKNNSDDFLLEYALKLRDLCHKYNAYFIVNDRVNLALKSEADGVHVGEEDENIEKVIEIMKGKIVGVSCYGSIERAKEMEKLGASYVAFGSFYPSPTKPTSKIVPKEIISQAKKELKIPVCVIGGITVERAKELIDLGADIVAVINDIWTSPDIKQRALEYKKLFD